MRWIVIIKGGTDNLGTIFVILDLVLYSAWFRFTRLGGFITVALCIAGSVAVT